MMDLVIWLPRPQPHENNHHITKGQSRKACRPCGRPIKSTNEFCKKCYEKERDSLRKQRDKMEKNENRGL